MTNLFRKVERAIVGIAVLAGTFTAVTHSADAAFRLRGMNTASTMTSQDIIDLNEFSANVVRYQISLGLAANTATEAEYFAWFNGELDHFDQLVPTFRAAGIKVIFDLHTPPGGFSNPNPPLPQMRIFSEMWAQEAVIRLWDQVASRYKDNDVIVAYQLVSEPATGKRSAPGLKSWYALQNILGTTVRKYDRKKYLIATAAYSAPGDLEKVKFPRKLGKVLHCINFYFPISFLRQGVELPVGTEDYPSKRFKKKSLEAALKKTIAFQKKKRALIYVAEFTSSRFGPAGSDVRYLQDLLSIFEKYKWNWTYHAWREALVWSIEHDSLDPTNATKAATRTGRATVLESYFAKNPVL